MNKLKYCSLHYALKIRKSYLMKYLLQYIVFLRPLGVGHDLWLSLCCLWLWGARHGGIFSRVLRQFVLTMCHNVTIHTANCIPIISDQREISHRQQNMRKIIIGKNKTGGKSIVLLWMCQLMLITCQLFRLKETQELLLMNVITICGGWGNTSSQNCTSCRVMPATCGQIIQGFSRLCTTLFHSHETQY